MSLIERDLQHIWHPCSQMKDYAAFPPIQIQSAHGVYLQTPSGHHIIDAISSWWCKSLGHNHPQIREALIQQAHQYEHIIGANTCSEPLVLLSEKLAQLNPKLSRVFYAGDGSSSVEIAIKMSLQAQQLRGKTARTTFMALENGYHGETIMTMALSDLGKFNKPFKALLPETHILKNLPYVMNQSEPAWNNIDAQWTDLLAQLEQHKDTLAAIVCEPIVQGSGGMLITSADFLNKLRAWCTENHVYLIADEIMTGIGRTGRALACEHAGITPDFVCLSKGLTSGWLTMSCVLTSDDIYNLFYDDYATGKTFMHSHTFSGNALAAACANATLDIIAEENIYAQVQSKSDYLAKAMQDVAIKTGLLKNVRHIGFIAAADLITEHPRAGFEVFKQAIPLGAWLRPIGNTIYWLPPLITDRNTIDILRDITIEAIQRSPI